MREVTVKFSGNADSIESILQEIPRNCRKYGTAYERILNKKSFIQILRNID